MVGSGAGGSAAAVILARAGYQVAIIEAGPWRVPDDYPNSMYGCLRDMMDSWSTKVARGDPIMPIVQARVVGGPPVPNSPNLVPTPRDMRARDSTPPRGDPPAACFLLTCGGAPQVVAATAADLLVADPTVVFLVQLVEADARSGIDGVVEPDGYGHHGKPDMSLPERAHSSFSCLQSRAALVYSNYRPDRGASAGTPVPATSRCW